MVRKLKFFTIFSLLFLLGLVLVSCGGQSGEQTTTTSSSGHEDHTHVYGEWVTDGENHWHQCSCGDKKDLAAHSLDVTQQDATCDHAGSITYSCGVCGYTNTVTTAKLDHKISTISYKDEEVAGQTCKHEHVTVGTCAHCGKEIEIDKSLYETHTYKSSIQTPATCSTEGTYLYKCTLCGDEYTVKYQDKDAHTWGDNPTIDGIKKTYKCTGCNAIKEVIDATQQVAAEVSKDDLTTVGAVELKNATIELDDNALQGFENATNINISADIVDKDTLKLDDKDKERIGENKVFDFQMQADGNQVSQFNGYITVTIPYELKATDDPNAIVIWYLNENGETEAISAKYSNGFVTFETNHFSYYVVVQMTPEEACKLFDHEYITISEKDSTCETLGVKVEKCTRCNHVKTTEIELKKHNWVEVRTQEPTISAPGLSVYECSICHQTKVIQLPKLSNKESSILSKMFDGIINQIKAEGIKVETVSEENGNYVAQIKLNGNLFYEVTKEADGDYSISLLDVSTGKSTHYSSNENGYYYSTSTMPASALASMDLVFNNKVFKLTDFLTQYVDSKLLDDFLNKILVLAFDITTENGTITYKFNADKLAKIYGEALDLTIGGILDTIIGAGTTDKIIASLTAAGDKTVQQVIDDISKQGIDVEGIINFALGYMDYYQSNYDIEMPFDTSMIKAKMPEIKKMKVNEVLAMIPNNKMTLTDIIGMVNQYKNAKITDLLSMMGGSSSQGSKPVAADTAIIDGESTEGNTGNTSSTSGPQIPTEADVKTLLKDYVIEVKLNQNYEVQSVYFKNADMNVTISKGENVIAEYEKAEKEIKAVVDKMIINGETKIYDNAFNQTYGTNLTFTYATKEGRLIATTNTFNETIFNKFKDDYYYDYDYDYYEYNKLSNKGNPTGYFLEVDFGSQNYVNIYTYDELNYITRYIYGNGTRLYGIIDGKPVYLGRIRMKSYIILNKTNNKYYLGNSFSLNQYVYSLVDKNDIPANANIEQISTDYAEIFDNIEGIEKDTFYLKGTNIFGGNDCYNSFDAYKKDGKYIYTHLNLSSYINLYPVELESFDYINIYYYFDGNLYYELGGNWREYNKETDGYTYLSHTSTNGKAAFIYKETINGIVKYELKVLGKTFYLDITDNKDYWYDSTSTLVASFNAGKCTVLNLYTAYNNPNVLVVQTATSHKEATRVLLPATITQNGLIEHYCTECGDEMHHEYITPTGKFTDNVEVLFEDFNSENPYLFGWYTGETYDYYSLWREYSVVLTVVEETIGENDEVVTTIVTDAPSVFAFRSEYRRSYTEVGKDGKTWISYPEGRFLEFNADDYKVAFADYTLAANQKLAIAATNNYSDRVTVYVIQ